MSELGDYGPKFRWKCEWPGCRREVVSWTENGITALSAAHLDDHEKENREHMVRFQAALDKFPVRNYDKLKIAYSDLVFLKTRGIKIDDDIEYDPTVKYEPYEGNGLSQRLWRQILDKIC